MPESVRPFVVAVDGPSGIGKSTILPLVADALIVKGYECTVAANNGAGPFAAAIRQLADDGQAPYSLAFATAGARAYLMETLGSNLVLCDRHVLSTLVYQGFAGIPRDYLYLINEPLMNQTLFVALELSTHELEIRRRARGRATDDWFKRGLPIEVEVELFRQAADKLAARGHRVARVRADGSIQLVVRRLTADIEQALAERTRRVV